MSRRWQAVIVMLAPAALAGCGQTLSLPPPPTTASPSETKSTPPPIGRDMPASDYKFTAAGQPVDIYTLVARGALTCWFGLDGPLKPTHVFTAEAAPPANGGQAEIVILERDVSRPDQRGARAFQVVFATKPAGTEVEIATQRMTVEVSQAMKQDVETWARGQPGCELRKLLAPPPPVSSKVGPRPR